MKIMQKELAQKLAAVRPAIPSNPSIAALKGVLVKDNKLTAYNLGYGITVTLDGYADECCILPPEAVQMIESMPDGDVEIQIQANNILIIKEGDIVHRISSHPPEEFPDLPKIISDEHVSIDAGTLLEGIEAVIYAVATADSKPVQMGVLFEAYEGTLNLVACDGFRLAWFRTEMSGRFKFAVSGEALQKILKLKLNGAVELTIGNLHAIFSTKDCSIVTRLMEGAFVDYQSVVPDNHNVYSVGKKYMLDSLRRAILCAVDLKQNAQGKTSKRLAPVVLTAGKDDSELNVSIRNHMSQHSETLPLNEKAPADLKMGFNTKYLIEAVQHCDGDAVEMYVGSPCQPMVIREGNVVSLVLPVNPKILQEASNG